MIQLIEIIWWWQYEKDVLKNEKFIKQLSTSDDVMSHNNNPDKIGTNDTKIITQNAKTAKYKICDNLIILIQNIPKSDNKTVYHYLLLFQ